MFDNKIVKPGNGRFQFACICIALLIGSSACKREVPKMELLTNYEGTSYESTFQAFWTGINSKYVFWDIDPVNWDSMYTAYKPKFDSLDLRQYSDTTQNLCFQYMVDMTKNLVDAQYTLQFGGGGNYLFQDSLFKSYLNFIPKLIRTGWAHPAVPDTLFDYIIPKNYLTGFDYGLFTDFNTGQEFQMTTGKIAKGVKNVYYAGLNYSFLLKEGYDASYALLPPRPVIQNFFKAIKQTNCDAVILDFRNNRGGNLEDINFFAGQFTTQPYIYGYARYKTAEGRLDFSPWLPMSVTPQTGSINFNKTIVILTNVYSASIAETMIRALKALPNAKVVVVGEHTYGSPGLSVGDVVATNSGSFYIGSFAGVNLSNTAVQDRNHRFNLAGITPDIEIKYDAAGIKTMLSTGIDLQLEKAIQAANQ